MTGLEQAAEEYVKSCNYSDVNEGYSPGEVELECVSSFKEGAAWQAKQSPWISVEERMPEDNELVLTSSGIYGTKLLVWNDFHKVWDDEDGDDCYCDRDKIDAWMSIPE